MIAFRFLLYPIRLAAGILLAGLLMVLSLYVCTFDWDDRYSVGCMRQSWADLWTEFLKP